MGHAHHGQRPAHPDCAGRDAAGNSTHVRAGRSERRQHELVPERHPGHRLRPADGDEVPSRRAAADRRAAGQDQGPSAAVHDARSRHRSCRSPTSDRRVCSRASSTSSSTPTSRPTTSITSSTRSVRRTATGCRASPPTPTLTGTVAGSEFVLYQDPEDANAEHHGGAIMFGNDGKIYFTTGEHFNAADAQSLNNPRGKIHRINPDGTVPTDNPFYDGTGPHCGLDLGVRAAQPVSRLLRRADRSHVRRRCRRQRSLRPRRKKSTSAHAAPTTAGPTSKATALRRAPARCTRMPHATAATTPRSPAASCTTAPANRFFRAAYEGSYFFGDYAQHWIKRLTLDATGNLTGVFNFEPADGSLFGPYGDIVYLTEGPDGSLYYLDLGYSDIGGTFGISKLRRIRYVCGRTNRRSRRPRPTRLRACAPDRQLLERGFGRPRRPTADVLLDFGDNTTSTAANPQHTYTHRGPVHRAAHCLGRRQHDAVRRRSRSASGSPPTATIMSPTDGSSSKRAMSSTSAAPAPTPTDGRFRPARSPGTSTSST